MFFNFSATSKNKLKPRVNTRQIDQTLCPAQVQLESRQLLSSTTSNINTGDELTSVTSTLLGTPLKIIVGENVERGVYRGQITPFNIPVVITINGNGFKINVRSSALTAKITAKFIESSSPTDPKQFSITVKGNVPLTGLGFRVKDVFVASPSASG